MKTLKLNGLNVLFYEAVKKADKYVFTYAEDESGISLTDSELEMLSRLYPTIARETFEKEESHY